MNMRSFGFKNTAFLAVAAEVGAGGGGGGGGGGFNPSSIAGLELWLDASKESYADLTPNPDFNDWSGNGRKYTTFSDPAIVYRTGFTPKGTSVMLYPRIINNAVLSTHASTFDLSTVMSTTAELFAVLSSDGPSEGVFQTMAWSLGKNWAMPHYWTNSGVIFEDFFSDTVHEWTTASTAANFNVFNAVSSPTEWTARFNGVVEYTTGTNTPGIHGPTTHIGGSGDAGLVGGIAELLIYSNVLSVADRADVESYLQSKHIA